MNRTDGVTAVVAAVRGLIAVGSNATRKEHATFSKVFI